MVHLNEQMELYLIISVVRGEFPSVYIVLYEHNIHSKANNNNNVYNMQNAYNRHYDFKSHGTLVSYFYATKLITVQI